MIYLCAEVSIDAYPLERCAALAASIAGHHDDKDKILSENELDSAAWDKLTKHWDAEINKETRSGKADLLRAYDTAYVAQLERERGLFTVEDFAEMTVATERGTVDEVLTKLGISRAMMVRVERVWGMRQRDRTIARKVSAAIRAARSRS